MDAFTQLHTSERHRSSSLLQGAEGAVEIERVFVCGAANGRVAGVGGGFEEFEQERLRVAGAEVEGGGFEHEAFEPDDCARGGLEDLGGWSN